MATIASLLSAHVRLRVRSVDRIFLRGYVPRLQTQGLLVRFFLDQGFPIPSPALLGNIGRRLRKDPQCTRGPYCLTTCLALLR